ncbi:MAG: phage scaffolding protein [Blautia sp.]|nr:phage scaffolding protein [Blautia sp.]
MKKEDLIAMGLTEEQAKQVMESLDGDFVTKTRFNELNEENKTLKQSVSDRDKQLENLKKSSGDNAVERYTIFALSVNPFASVSPATHLLGSYRVWSTKIRRITPRL